MCWYTPAERTRIRDHRRSHGTAKRRFRPHSDTPRRCRADSIRQPSDRHLGFLAEGGLDGVLVLGTNGEFPSFELRERLAHAEAAARAASGLSLMLGVGSCALPDVIELVRAARTFGYQSVLLPPPFYFRSAPPEGLIAFFLEVLDAAELPVLLYHIPQVTGIAISRCAARRGRRSPAIRWGQGQLGERGGSGAIHPPGSPGARTWSGTTGCCAGRLRPAAAAASPPRRASSRRWWRRPSGLRPPARTRCRPETARELRSRPGGQGDSPPQGFRRLPNPTTARRSR